MKKLLLLFLIFFFTFVILLNGSSLITIYYYERPPYYYTSKNGTPQGILINITKKIFKIANIDYKFSSIPNKRIFSYLKEENFSCSPGWYFTQKRSKIFKYTLPIYESEPIVAIINSKKWQKKQNIISIDKLFHSNMILGLISGFNYGKIIDEKLKQHNNIKVRKLTVSMDKIIFLTAINRIDFTFVSKENIDFFLKKNKDLKKFLFIVSLYEIKRGEKRYIICSQKVPDAIINKINKAILKLKNEK